MIGQVSKRGMTYRDVRLCEWRVVERGVGRTLILGGVWNLGVERIPGDRREIPL